MIAGIDGGGTSTRLELRDDANRPVQRLTFGPFNISAVGEAGVRSVLRELCEAVDVRAIDRLCVGGAGVSFAGLRELLLVLFKNRHSGCRCHPRSPFPSQFRIFQSQ